MEKETTQEVREQSARPAAAPKAVKPKKKIGKVIFLLLSYLIVGVAVWQITAQLQNDPAKQQARAEAEVKDLVKKVSTLMILPADELPQVATIQDAESLASTQEFFVGVKNGDQVLIYLTGKKAIIYRPSEHKIVNVGPVVAESENATGTSQTAPRTQAPATTNTQPRATSTTNTTVDTNNDEADEN